MALLPPHLVVELGPRANELHVKLLLPAITPNRISQLVTYASRALQHSLDTAERRMSQPPMTTNMHSGVMQPVLLRGWLHAATGPAQALHMAWPP